MDSTQRNCGTCYTSMRSCSRYSVAKTSYVFLCKCLRMLQIEYYCNRLVQVSSTLRHVILRYSFTQNISGNAHSLPSWASFNMASDGQASDALPLAVFPTPLRAAYGSVHGLTAMGPPRMDDLGRGLRMIHRRRSGPDGRATASTATTTGKRGSSEETAFRGLVTIC